MDPPIVVQKKHHKFAHHLIQKRLTSSILWLNVKEQKPAVLAIVPPYSEAYVPASLDQDLPMVLSDMYKKDYLSLGYRSRLQLANQTNVCLTADQAKAVESKTMQRSSKV